VSVSVGGLRQLRAALAGEPDAARERVRSTMSRAGLQLKRRMQAEASGSQSLRGVPASIGYDLKVGATLVEVEVGPEVGRAQGSLAFIGYEGTATSGPIFPDPVRALEAEADVTARYLGDELGRSL
jgi:hypothetical protein